MAKRSKTTARRATTASDPFASRRARVKRSLAGHGAEAMLVSDPKDVAYLTGFLGGDSYLVIPARGKPTILSDSRYLTELEPLAKAMGVHDRSGQKMHEAVAQVAGGERLAIQGETMTVQERDLLAKAHGARRLVPTAGVLAAMRAIKDDTEIANIRKAIRIHEAALEQVVPAIRPGMTELEICADLEHAMMRGGSSGPAFGTIVGAGATSALPHYAPQKRKLAKRGILLIDSGATFNGYRSDLTRTMCFGRWTHQERDVFSIVLEAHEAAAARLAPGVPCRDVDGAARDVITRAGYGDKFRHGLGHGVGLNIHEAPSLSARAPADALLKPGHVVTIEPGVYLPHKFGVRIEDDYLVTETGAKRLSRLGRDLDWATR